MSYDYDEFGYADVIILSVNMSFVMIGVIMIAMLSAIMLNIIMLNFIKPSVNMPNVSVLSSVVKLCANMLKVMGLTVSSSLKAKGHVDFGLHRFVTEMYSTWGQSFKTFYGGNLRIFVIS